MKVKLTKNKIVFKIVNNELICVKQFKKGDILTIEKSLDIIKILDKDKEEYIVFNGETFMKNDFNYSLKKIEVDFQEKINKRINELRDMCKKLNRDLDEIIKQDIRIENILNDYNDWCNII